MSNRYLVFIILLTLFFGCKMPLTRRISNKLYKVDNKEDRFIILSKKKEKYLYLHYRFEKDKSFLVKGYLRQVSKRTFITYNETIESIMVDSLLNKIPIDKTFKKEIKEKLNHDTLFFSKNYKYLIYNNQEFKVIKK